MKHFCVFYTYFLIDINLEFKSASPFDDAHHVFLYYHVKIGHLNYSRYLSVWKRCFSHTNYSTVCITRSMNNTLRADLVLYLSIRLLLFLFEYLSVCIQECSFQICVNYFYTVVRFVNSLVTNLEFHLPKMVCMNRSTEPTKNIFVRYVRIVQCL